jgi:hypothetical protein
MDGNSLTCNAHSDVEGVLVREIRVFDSKRDKSNGVPLCQSLPPSLSQNKRGRRGFGSQELPTLSLHRSPVRLRDQARVRREIIFWRVRALLFALFSTGAQKHTRCFAHFRRV